MIMVVELFFRGLVLGFSIAAPIGPIGVLCIRRTIAGGKNSGFVSGLGAATVDAFYSSIAAFGLTIISNFLLNQFKWLRYIGGFFLCYLGYSTFFSKPSEEKVKTHGYGLVSDYFSTLLLTIANPTTIISFIALFASFGVLDAGFDQSMVLVMGVFMGSAFWWFILSTVVSIFRVQFDKKWVSWSNRISGLAIFAFGLFALFGPIRTS
jgi:threonine/homoserine/homoserine lactone efflux protein